MKNIRAFYLKSFIFWRLNFLYVWIGVYEYPQSMFWTEIWKISELFIWKCSVFGGEIFYLFEYRHVFVMLVWLTCQKVHYHTLQLKYKVLTLPLSWQLFTKTCLYNFDPLKPHFYIVKLGFTGVYIIFLISPPKHRFWVLVRTASPRRF